LIAAVFVAGLLSACRRDEQIQSYTAPKESPPPAQAQPPPGMAMGDPNAMPVTVNSAPVHWTTPAAWKEIAPTAVRLGNFVVPGAGANKAEVTITSFPGDVGGTLANVNRWRRENALPDITESEITSENTAVDSIPGKLYDFSGTSSRTVVAVISRDGASWFFKMKGDLDTVAGARPAFLDFLKTIHFGPGEPTTTTVADPHAGMNMAPATAPASSPGAPVWTTPATWTETTPGPMVVKSFTIAGDSGQKAAVSISEFQGEVGGTLANVNRWRRQIGLAEISAADLPQTTQSTDFGGVKGTVVDFNGTDPASHQPVRLIAASVPHAGDTWFYKITGDPAVVAREKDGFVKFVQSARYP
jgi:hypothetical protein